MVSVSNKNIVLKGFAQLNWHDFNANILIDKYYRLHGLENYDECVLNLEIESNLMIRDYVLIKKNNTRFLNQSLVSYATMQRARGILTNTNKICSNPKNTINSKIISSISRERQTLKLKKDYNDDIFTGDLKLKEQKRKPKVTVQISRFTKVVKVIPN